MNSQELLDGLWMFRKTRRNLSSDTGIHYMSINAYINEYCNIPEKSEHKIKKAFKKWQKEQKKK